MTLLFIHHHQHSAGICKEIRIFLTLMCCFCCWGTSSSSSSSSWSVERNDYYTVRCDPRNTFRSWLFMNLQIPGQQHTRGCASGRFPSFRQSDCQSVSERVSQSVRESVSITVDNNNNTKHICRFGAVLGFKLYVSKLIFMVEMKLHVITIAHCNCILPEEEDDDDHHHQDDDDGDANGCR